ncbi:MAG: GTPase ObgE [Chlamydiales bacterium]|nr:GTPase ObgE [Chlamydiales bacterium]
MFIDSVTLTLSAGKGGNGVVAWRREKYIPKGGPSGGNGGKGASLVLRAYNQETSLEGFRNRRIIKAENGGAGGGAHKQGHNGKSLVLNVPCGTLVKDARTKEVLFDFTEDKQEWIACRGGRGGRGNASFRSPTHQAPNICTEGTEGESREIELELKLIADVGLVGFPNAGKSTLMSKITKLRVKIGAYPFTTLFPNLSYIELSNYSRILVADIPGIIEDAHEDRGLGLSFLKHIERTSVLLFVIDVSGFEGRDPVRDYEILREELRSYDPKLLEKPSLVALNKIDMEGAEEQIARFREQFNGNPKTIFEISSLEAQGLKPLLAAVEELVCPALALTP